MEHKQFISDALSPFPPPNLSFQADKYAKKNTYLSIPGTILEQSSAELSGDSLKMEASFNDDKENIKSNQQVMWEETPDNSKIIAIDNSFIKNCEKKLLESSNNDEENPIELENKSASNMQHMVIPRTLVPNNDSISTPPSLLRKEISILRSELAAADEFHDFEIQLLKEEKSVNEVDLKNYMEVLQKNAALMELYTTLKNEYDEYRKEQEKVRHELESKTTDCLESLCSQIEASDSSLNFSSTSFVSFNGGIKSSTMLDDVSEVEATVMHDGTVLANDPLSISCDGIFKTPLQTPMRSAKKLFPQEFNLTSKTPVVKEVKERIDKGRSTTPRESEHHIQLLTLEAALYDKVKEVESLEHRLFKVEDMSGVLKSECERMKESLSKKTEQLNELTQKLYAETISLNPALRDSLTDVPGVRLLVVFIETIMEKCKNIQDDLISKHLYEKAEWERQVKTKLAENESVQEEVKSLNEQLASLQGKFSDLEEFKTSLEKKLTDAENTILTREVEMRILQSNVRQAQEDFTLATETLSKLESQISSHEAEKKEVENRCRGLEETIKNLKEELELKEKLAPELDDTKCALERIQKEKENLKQVIQQSEELIAELRSESVKKFSDAESTISSQKEEIETLQSCIRQIQEDLNTSTEALCKLQTQLSSNQTENGILENRCQALEETVKNLKDELELKEKLLSDLQAATSVIESVQKENENLKQIVQQSEETIAHLKSESLQSREEFNAKLLQEIESLKSKEASRFNPVFDVLNECKRILTEVMSSNSEIPSESRAFDLLSEKLHDSADPQLLSAVKAVMEFVKVDWDSRRKLDLTVIENLQNQIKSLHEKARETDSKLVEILAENSEFNKLCENLKVQLHEAEDIVSVRNAEISSLKRQEDILRQLKCDLALLDEVETSDLPTDRIEKLITDRPELQEDLNAGETKIVSVFIETLTKTCKGVQNELIKKIENTKVEWESRRNMDLNLIESLQSEIEVLTEKTDQQETKIAEMNLEKEELQKLHDNMTNEVMEAEKMISNCNEEIRILRTHEVTLKQTKEELTTAEETILALKSQLNSTESVKADIESRCRELEDNIEDVKRALDSSENLHNVTKFNLETAQRKNEKLQEIIDESEKVINRLKSESCQHNPEELFREIESLKTEENRRFSTFFKIVEDSKEKLREMMSENSEEGLTENAAFKLISESLTENADSQLLSAVEAVMDFMKIEWDDRKSHDLNLIENLQNEIRSLTEKAGEYEAKITELLRENSDSNKLCEDLRNRLRETENRLSLQDAEIVILKKQEEVLNEMKGAIALADETITKLNTQLSLIEAEKKEVESHYQNLEEVVKKLKEELDLKEKLLPELDAATTAIESIRKENEHLKEVIEKYEETVNRVQSESLRKTEELTQELESLRSKESFRFNDLFEVLGECQKAIAESVSSSTESESRGFDMLSEKLLDSADPMLLSAVKAVVEFVKADWDSKRKVDLTVIENLQNQIRILNEKSNECEDLKVQLREAEDIASVRNAEISSLKRQEDILRQLKGDLALLDEVETSDLPTDRIEKLITDRPELQEDLNTGETKIVSVFIETLTKTCKGVQNELIKKIENTKVEWESRRNMDLNLIESLQSEIEVLTEKTDQQETKIAEMNLEKEELQKLHDNMSNEVMEAEKMISNCNEEIRILRTHEVTLKQTKEELTIAEESILKLKSQLVSTESQKVEIELRCRQLEEGTAKLKAEIDTKETIIQGLDELKLMRERMETENEELKQQMQQSEEVILQLRKGLETAKEEQDERETRIKSLLDEMEVLKKEKDDLTEFSEKLEELEKNNKDLLDILADVISHLGLPEDTMTKLLSGKIEKNIFREKMNNLVKSETEGLKAENKTLKLSNENLKDKVKQLTKLLCESASADLKEELSNLNLSQVNPMTLRSRSNKNIQLCVRRLDKLEEINHNLTELLTQILTMTELPDLEKLKLCSARDYPNITKKVVAHINSFQSKVKELKEENAQLDEECETYSNIIKDLKKEAASVWRANKEKTEAMEADISRLTEEKSFWEKEKQELMARISKLESECQKLKSTPKNEGLPHSCSCGNELKKINELKRTILMKEQKLLELQDLEAQASSYKSQTEYLKNALEREKKKVGEEKDKNKKLRNELNEATKNHKSEGKKVEQNEVLEELRMRGTISGGVVQEYVDKEKIRKLSKDIGILKEMCRARYAEIKRLEGINASLRNNLSKNSNQMDSFIRSRGYNTRSKNPIRDVWKSEISGKENSPARADVL